MSKPTSIRAFAVSSAGGQVSEFLYEPMALGANEVEVEIECCGVCHSDVHQHHNDWGTAHYPIVLGHEIIGRVIAKGDLVDSLDIGARVGIGPQTGSCDSCKECKQGGEQFCSKIVKSYNSATGDAKQPYTYGGFSERIRTRADWAIPIPDGLDSINAAPLLCAGETTWTPLIEHGVKKGDKVAIAGVGGLGHIALQFAHHLGCEVTAISHSSNKESECRALGADHFLNSSDAEAMKRHTKTFDFILSTISAVVKWDIYLNLLRPKGTLCMVGLPKEVSFRPGLLVSRSLRLAGSFLANPREIRRMLEFAAKHKVQAMTETLPMSVEGCNQALDRVLNNQPRYRMVLLNSK